MDDLFEELHGLEDAEIERGKEAGYNDGLAMGLLEGRELGAQKGYEIGVEAGFYQGCCQTWRELKAMDPDAIPEKAEKALSALEEALATLLPVLKHPRDPKILELVEEARGRFKAATTMMGLSKEYSAPISSSLRSIGEGPSQGEVPKGIPSISLAALDF